MPILQGDAKGGKAYQARVVAYSLTTSLHLCRSIERSLAPATLQSLLSNASPSIHPLNLLSTFRPTSTHLRSEQLFHQSPIIHPHIACAQTIWIEVNLLCHHCYSPSRYNFEPRRSWFYYLPASLQPYPSNFSPRNIPPSRLYCYHPPSPSPLTAV